MVNCSCAAIVATTIYEGGGGRGAVRASGVSRTGQLQTLPVLDRLPLFAKGLVLEEMNSSTQPWAWEYRSHSIRAEQSEIDTE